MKCQPTSEQIDKAIKAFDDHARGEGLMEGTQEFRNAFAFFLIGYTEGADAYREEIERLEGLIDEIHEVDQ